ncbi:MAG: hypothetical protein V4719_27410 [Planctomycetota bacterium]
MNLQGLLELIRCPKSKALLIHDGDWLVSSDPVCRLKYEIKQDIPVLIPEEAVEMSPEDWGNVMEKHGRNRVTGQAS